ncbi:MAG: hypothetical protein VW397_08480, partial [Candidatus Margulisiibacteriota bacterium]
SFMECSKLSISSSEFMFSQNDTYSLRFQSNTLMLKNISNGTEAVLYRYINLDSTNEIRYFDYFFNQTSQIDDVQYIDLRLGSSLLDHSVLTGIMCDNQQIKIGEF